ncbi:porin [Zoogloea sp.]|uniref:porin n=1 Tax=Zoogloea sp. TaxID=49181 RepID=UPI0035B3708E
MQKKLIALAVAGLASTAAFAQSNVTVYGVADGSFDVVKVSNSAADGNNLGNTTRVSTNSSLIGFKGAESLGNGLTAVFQFESGIGFENGGSLSASRDSYVGVAGGFGTVVLGTLTGPTRALGSALDVNAGATGIGANTALLGKLGNHLVGTTDTNGSYTANAGCTTRSSTCASIFDTRWKNAIAYVSPTFAGLSLTAAYVANENKSTAGNLGTAAQANTTGYDVGLKYANGPVMAAVTYNAVDLGNNNTSFSGKSTDVADFRVGASYDFGIATVRALFDSTRADNYSTVGKATQNVYGLGATYNVTPAGKLLAQAYFARDLKVNGSSAKDTGAKLFELGYEHSLSKRTMLKAVYAHLNNDDGAAYDFGINATGVAKAGATVQGLSLGLRHTF